MKEQSYLSDQWILDADTAHFDKNVTDSYGRTHAEVLEFWAGDCSIIFNLNNEYAFFACDIFIGENAPMDRTGIVTIKADDKVVYTSPTLTKKTDTVKTGELFISNCSLLTIEYTSDSNYMDCLLDNMVLYN